MSKLRSITKKTLTPVTKWETNEQGEFQIPEQEIRNDEVKSGQVGTGPLVRKYISNLDMNFYASRAAPKGTEAAHVSLRISEDLAKDISIMIGTQKTRFRERSEFIRTAIHILLNYYAPIVNGEFEERIGLRDTQDHILYLRNERLRRENIIEAFRSDFPNFAKDGDEILHRWLVPITNSVKKEKQGLEKDKLIDSLSNIMKDNHVDPLEYFENYKDIKR